MAPACAAEQNHAVAGRQIWLETCEGCHGVGIAGAPVATNFKKWEPRIAKGKDVLYEHALNGFFGPGGTMMPERGGNPNLTDDEVRAAVDYMISLALSHAPKSEPKPEPKPKED